VKFQRLDAISKNRNEDRMDSVKCTPDLYKIEAPKHLYEACGFRIKKKYCFSPLVLSFYYHILLIT
ncbi:hypothetical protein Avbf_12792, partial [Armadillidium vulgare]